jgi:hypothetical protein
MKRTLLALALLGTAFAEEGRPLRMEVVDQVIEKNDRAVQACGRGNGHDLLAVQLMLEIDAQGMVVAAAPVDKASSTTHCLARIAKRLHFPATGVSTKIAYPFMLRR